MPAEREPGAVRKFERVFEQIDDIKERLTKVEVYEEVEKEQLKLVVEKLDEMKTTLNQIIGKESVRASIYGVVGAVVSGIVTWIITLVKGSMQ